MSRITKPCYCFDRAPRRRGISAAAFLASALILAGCSATGVAVGAGAGTAVAVSQERGFAGTLNDTKTRTEINVLWFHKNVDMYHALGLSIYEGRVLLTGVVKSEKIRADAVRLTWQAIGVKEVINEILVDATGKTKNYPRDVWITAQLKTKVLFDKKINAINYGIETVNNTVYLFGIAQSRVELKRVVDHARNLKYVNKVVNHVLLKFDPRRHRL